MIADQRLAAERPVKIQRHHLERLAIVYVRQSHPQQVQRHRESAQVQANLQQRADAWGWPGERIRVLDGDQGRSGTMGGFELHQLQQRMQAGRLNRCRRGEWLGQPPPGYIVGPAGKLQFDPDEQAQQVIRLILEQFASQGSISGVLRYLRQQQIQLPFRPMSGRQRGQLCWHQPHRETLRLLLRRPAYAGVYTWGRRAVDPRRCLPGERGRARPRVRVLSATRWSSWWPRRFCKWWSRPAWN